MYLIGDKSSYIWLKYPLTVIITNKCNKNVVDGGNMIRLSPTKAIRAKCLDCCCWQEAEVRLCTIKTCSLWRYRMGKEERDELYVRTNRGNKALNKQGKNSVDEDEPLDG